MKNFIGKECAVVEKDGHFEYQEDGECIVKGTEKDCRFYFDHNTSILSSKCDSSDVCWAVTSCIYVNAEGRLDSGLYTSDGVRWKWKSVDTPSDKGAFFGTIELFKDGVLVLKTPFVSDIVNTIRRHLGV